MIEAQLISSALEYQIVLAFMVFIGVMIFLAIMVGFLTPRKSQTYRKLLTDMFVAGKIKLLAKKENINLADEEKNFNLWCKKKRLEFLDLDRAIEEEMKEKIANVDDKKSTKDKE